MWPIGRPWHWVGRRQELTALRAGAEALRRGAGAVVWVEGEPGIGKSSLVAQALAEAGERRCARAYRRSGDRRGLPER
jgi:predicted ATPase